MNRLTGIIVASLLGCTLSCKNHEEGHDHSEAHPTGHDHHEEGHGHGDTPTVSMTLWSDQFEIFAEHPAGVVGQEISFHTHVTTLNDFRGPQEGTVTLELDGPSPLRGQAVAPVRPGIFEVTVTPTAAGKYTGLFRIGGEDSGEVKGVELQVYADSATAAKSVAESSDEGLIEFLKEQQWGVPFATAFAQTGSLVASVEVAGRIDTPPGGSSEVSAPVTGRLVSPSSGLPRPGTIVRKGQILASLVPAPSSPEAAARASLAVAEAEARASAARAAVTRAERLIKDEAIAQRELEDARRETEVAQESVRAAKRAAALYSGASESSGRGTWRLTAPISGTLVSVRATPGATVSPGETLFRIVDTKELWVVARVPEQEAARLRTNRDASFQVAGLDTWIPIDITGEDATAAVVTIGRVIDPTSRTVDAIYTLNEPNESLRVGGLVQVNLPAGEDFEGLVIPRTALVVQEGRTVVYVQVDGEHFQERSVTAGARAGDQVGIKTGLKSGERIVTKGTHLLRLAERAGGEQSHGHIH